MRFNWSINAIDCVDAALKKFARYLEEIGCLESTVELYVGNVNRYLRFTGTDRHQIKMPPDSGILFLIAGLPEVH
jgi:hypothetical protein